MRHLVVFICMAVLLSCSRTRVSDESFPDYLSVDEDWITYEGTLPCENGVDAHIELSVKPGAPGMKSHYSMHETTSGKYAGSNFVMGRTSQGTYSVLESADARIMAITDKNTYNGLIKGRPVIEGNLVQDDLYLKISGDHELRLLDDNLQHVSEKYTLIRRTSPLFTVEGYFTAYDDTTDFFERNTLKTWSVAQLGEYDLALKKYNYVSKEKFEGVYLKALSYTVRGVDKSGNEMDALVFKRLLEEDSLRSANEQ